MVSSCINLEFLCLRNLHFLRNFKIFSSTLKELELGFYQSNVGSLDICAPNLSKITFDCFSMAKYCCRDLSSLVEARFEFDRAEEDYEGLSDILLLISGVERACCRKRGLISTCSFRFLGGLKKLVRQKARVEGSICEAYLVKEVSNFCSMYFEEDIETNLNRPNRHDVPNEPEDPNCLPLFRYPGRGTFVVKHRYYMDVEEYNTAHVYILCNTPEIQEYIEMYHDLIEELCPELTIEERIREVSKMSRLATWLRNHVRNNMDTIAHLRTLSSGPAAEIKRYKGYYVNGYYFDIRQGDGNKSNFNSGVCVKGSCYEDDDHVDYYGVIEEIWELSYGFMNDKVVLFKCFWYDTSKWMQVHPRNGMVQIKHKSRGSKDDPFILASQAQQVYYLRYVSTSRDHKQWCVAMKTNARSRVDWTHMQNVDVSALDTEDIFQEEQQPSPVRMDPPHEVEIVEEGVFVVLGEGEDDDAGQQDSSASEYESDYHDDYLEEDYWGDKIDEDYEDY